MDVEPLLRLLIVDVEAPLDFIACLVQIKLLVRIYSRC